MENLAPPTDAYLLAERSCQISFRSDVKWQSIRVRSHWHEYRLRVIHTSFTRTSRAFTVTRTSKHLKTQTPRKIWCKLWNTLNFLQKFTPVTPAMLFVNVYVKITSYLYYVLY